ncbi:MULTISPECIES: DUF308 domain-containing protein [unclassified Haladaptatus]|uniref:HdeD family acid-resistance protein n=1 Tax=unclassified Haladaptatus TaxID=2622732 RepID=UPI00209C517D|nr:MULTISPECIES: DUF308 domain-containing protein [unclassified Haladaptatus]MCO8244323.1 DUF308 domain-containing protein [Haladaptatus sp. AB643]MCO8254053.1 DUF308 domain-containing protein [Haladaptatus sp. AB618]
MGVEIRNQEPSQDRPASSAESRWRLLLGVGVLLILLSIVAVVGAARIRAGLGGIPLLVSFATPVAISSLFGVLLLLGGTVLTASGFGAREWSGSRGAVLLAVVYTVFGLVLLVNPLAGVASLTALLFGFFLLDGLLEIGIGVQTRPETGWVWVVLSGVVALLAAVVVLLVPPVGSLEPLSVVFGVNLFVSGVSFAIVAMGRRRAARERTPVPSPGTARH